MAYTLRRIEQGGPPKLGVKVKDKETGIESVFCLYFGPGVPSDLNIGAIMRDIASSKEYQILGIVDTSGIMCKAYYLVEVA